MKNKIHYVLAICLVLIVGVQIIDYVKQGEINFSSMCIVFALLPMTIKGFKPEVENIKNFRYFQIIMTVLAVCMLIIQLVKTM